MLRLPLHAITFALTLSFVVGCRNSVVYPPPPQRRPEVHTISAFLDMTGDRPEPLWASIVSGMFPGSPELNWRWTSRHSEFRFKIDPAQSWRLAVGFTVAQVALRKAGPQRVEFRVNGELLGAAVYSSEGRRDLQFPVARSLMAAASPATVSIDVDPCMIEGSNPPYGVLLHKIGFVQEQP